MENDKVIQYIKNGDERALLDKLRAYSFTAFNKQIKNLLKILLVLIEEANDKIAPYQFFYKTVVNVLHEIIFEKEKLAEFVILLKTNSLPPYQQTSFLVREFIIGVEDKKFEGAEYEKNKITSEQLLEFKSEMIKVNISLLKKAIEEKIPHDQIMAIFYSCVERLEAERKIIINEKAIELLREYLKNNPEEYFKSFFRPYYSGPNKMDIDYYLHIGEPFFLQIFDGYQGFWSFLKKIDKTVSVSLVSDLKNYIERIEQKKGNQDRVLLFESDYWYSGDVRGIYSEIPQMKYIRLTSSEHVGVRPECLPKS